ncbi:unnamed protein product, partial [Arctogadus glacialis]
KLDANRRNSQTISSMENTLGGLKCNLPQLMKNVLGVNTVWSADCPSLAGRREGPGLNNRSRCHHRRRRRRHHHCSPEKERGMSNVCKWGLLSGETR